MITGYSITRSERYQLLKALADYSKISDSPWEIIEYSGDGKSWIVCTTMPKFTENVLYRVNPSIEW